MFIYLLETLAAGARIVDSCGRSCGGGLSAYIAKS
jgi:hypothetical protein